MFQRVKHIDFSKERQNSNKLEEKKLIKFVINKPMKKNFIFVLNGIVYFHL